VGIAVKSSAQRYSASELWALDELSDRCAADGRWGWMIVAKPLKLIWCAGSPLNAVAIR
jgi:hypothetical protein